MSKCELEKILIDLADVTRLIYKTEEHQTEDNQSDLSDRLADVTLEIRKRYEILSGQWLMSEVKAADRYKKQFENENN